MRRAAIAIASVAIAACAGADGRVRGDGGPVPPWSLRPNRCDTAAGAHYIGFDTGFGFNNTFDLYYAGPDAHDTEVVVRAAGPDSSVLVRIPEAHKMVVLHKTDCQVLDVSVHDTPYSMNDSVGVAGRVTLDCNRPEIGHVVGSATFTCF